MRHASAVSDPESEKVKRQLVTSKLNLPRIISAVLASVLLPYAITASAQRTIEVSASDKEMLLAIETLDHARVERLLKHGFPVNAPFLNSGTSPTHVAARIGDEKMLALFVAHGAIVDLPTRDARKDTPLLVAAGAGNLETARYLLAHGANPNYQNGINQDDYAVAHYAPDSRNGLKMLQLLRRYKTNFDVVSLNKTSVLAAAIFAERADAVGFLLNNGANAEANDLTGLRPICNAVLTEDIGIVRVMVNHRVSLNHLDCSDGAGSKGLSPLHVASRSGAAEIVRLLTKAGANVELRSTGGMIPEELANAEGHTEIASYLSRLRMGR